MMKKTQIYAHRCGAGLFPENSLPAVVNAIDLGADVLDVDVVMTKDDVVVAYHDLFLNSDYTQLNGQWVTEQTPIRSLTFDELAQYDIGQVNKASEYGQQFPEQQVIPNTPIVSLEEIIHHANEYGTQKQRFQIEMKSDPRHPEWSASPEDFAKAVLDVLTLEGMIEYTEVHSFDWRNLLALQKLCPELTTSFISSMNEDKQLCDPEYKLDWFAGHNPADFDNSMPAMIQHLNGKIWCPDFQDVTVENVTEAHELELRVIPWTVDLKTDMANMIKIEVDGIITNRPDRLLEITREN